MIWFMHHLRRARKLAKLMTSHDVIIAKRFIVLVLDEFWM